MVYRNRGVYVFQRFLLQYERVPHEYRQHLGARESRRTSGVYCRLGNTVIYPTKQIGDIIRLQWEHGFSGLACTYPMYRAPFCVFVALLREIRNFLIHGYRLSMLARGFLGQYTFRLRSMSE